MLSNIILVSKGHDSKETNISLNPNYGSLIPDPLISGSFDMIWWNLSDYISPSEDPYAEIVKCIARYDDNLIIMRSQQGTSISDKNIPNKIYGMSILSDYTSTISSSNTNTNIFKNLSYYNISQIHGKTRHDSSTLDGGTTLPLGQLPSHGSSQHTGTIGTENQITFSTAGHYHTGSDSKKVDHLNLLSIGTNSHTQIDTHIGASSAHGTASTIVGTADSQTLTNKTITDSTNNVMAKSLQSATTTIDVSSASAPSSGQVLTATSDSAATWQTLTSPSIGSKSQYFTSSGTFAVPTTVSLVWVTLWGGGGGGGAGTASGGTGGGGGGSGEALVQKPVNVTSGANITVTIGNGGNAAAAASGSTGSDGTVTSFGSVTANPGKGGIGNAGGGAGGAGGGVIPGTGGTGNSSGPGNPGNVGTFRGIEISGSGGGGYGNLGANGGPFPPFSGGLYGGYGGGGAAGYNGNGANGGINAAANSGAGGGGGAGNGGAGNGGSGGCLVEWIG